MVAHETSHILLLLENLLDLLLLGFDKGYKVVSFLVLMFVVRLMVRCRTILATLSVYVA